MLPRHQRRHQAGVEFYSLPAEARETSWMMIREARKVAKDYPGIDLWEAAAVMTTIASLGSGLGSGTPSGQQMYKRTADRQFPTPKKIKK